MDCLNHIIGLSRTECPCNEEGRPTDYNESASGVFADEMPGFNIDVASGEEDCNKDGIWDILSRAVENAKIEYRNNLLGCLNQTYKPRINNFAGQVGESVFSGTLSINHSYMGMVVHPSQLKGGYITLKRIGVLINQSAPVDIRVYSNENYSTLIYSSVVPLNAVANTLTWAALTTPLELPMWSNNRHDLKYFILLVKSGTWQPKKNKVSCGCGGNKEPWKQWLNVTGGIGNDVTNMNSFNSTSELNGVVIDIDLKCKASEIICSDQYPLDFLNDSTALSKAFAMRARTCAMVYEDLLGSGNINRFKLLNGDYCAAKIKEWNEIYTNWVKFECENSNNLGENDCLVCRDTKTSLRKRNIIVTHAGIHEY